MYRLHVSRSFVYPEEQALRHCSRISFLESVPWLPSRSLCVLTVETAELHNDAEDEIPIRLMSFQALLVEFGGMEFAGRTRA